MQIKVYVLQNCFFSNEAKKLFKPFPHVDIIEVDHTNKEKYKKIIRPWNTFPCIKIIYDNKQLTVGGLKELQHILDNEFILKDACDNTDKFKNTLSDIEQVIKINKKYICKFFKALYKPNN